MNASTIAHEAIHALGKHHGYTETFPEASRYNPPTRRGNPDTPGFGRIVPGRKGVLHRCNLIPARLGDHPDERQRSTVNQLTTPDLKTVCNPVHRVQLRTAEPGRDREASFRVRLASAHRPSSVGRARWRSVLHLSRDWRERLHYTRAPPGAQPCFILTHTMSEAKKPDQGTAPELPPVDAAELERALRRAVETKKPPGGWKRARKGQRNDSPKPTNG